MLAAVWHGPRDVRVLDHAEPELSSDTDVLVAVDMAYICASDIAEYRDGPHVIPVSRPHPLTRRIAPIILGHEYVGRVSAVGGAVEHLAIGDRVCGDSCIRCGSCYWCLRGEYNICEKGGSVGLHTDGAFASRLSVPAYTLTKVPADIPDLSAGLIEPLAVGLHALRRARFQAGESVAVLGFGMVGAAVAAVAQALGAGRVIVVEMSASRGQLAAATGALVVAPDDEVRRAVRAATVVGADIAVDCTGNPAALTTAIEITRRGGRVVMCGIPHSPSTVSLDRLVYFERELIGALGYRFDHETIVQLLASGRLQLPALTGDPIPLRAIVDEGLLRSLRDPTAPIRIPVLPEAE